MEWREVTSLWPWRKPGIHELVRNGAVVGDVRIQGQGWRATIRSGLRLSKVFQNLEPAKGWVEKKVSRPD